MHDNVMDRLLKATKIRCFFLRYHYFFEKKITFKEKENHFLEKIALELKIVIIFAD